MSRKYKVLLPLRVDTEDGSYGQGDVFEKDFSVEDEAENLASGLLELQPLEYRVVGESNVHGADPGEVLTAAIPLGQEELLIQGGHIEPIEPEKPKAKTRKKKEG